MRTLKSEATAARIIPAMQQIIEVWHWRVTDPVSRCRYVTRYRMTELNALDFDPAAERIEGSLERLVVHVDQQAISTRSGYRMEPVNRKTP